MAVLSKEFFDIQATIERGFTLKRVHDMIRTYNQYPGLQEVMKLMALLKARQQQSLHHDTSRKALPLFNLITANLSFRISFKSKA